MSLKCKIILGKTGITEISKSFALTLSSARNLVKLGSRNLLPLILIFHYMVIYMGIMIYDFTRYTTREINVLYNALTQYKPQDKNEEEIAKLMRKDLYAELLKRRQKA
jgi:hypothetical protein